MTQSLIILFTIFISAFLLILLTRLVIAVLLNRAYKNFQKIKNLAQKTYGKKKNYIKEEDEIKLEKIEFPRAHSEVKAEMKANKANNIKKDNKSKSGSYEIIPSRERQQDNDIQIVDIVKPVGFWTSMILGQKLTYLIQSAQVLNKRGDKGFWASMIEAKEREAGRQHSRGR
jgi:hypothetical protein